MPAMANMTVLDASGSNQTFTAATPSAGDRSPAVWRNNATSAISGFRPTFSVLTRDNGKRTARHLSISFRYPVTFTDATSGAVSLVAVVPATVEVTLPTNVDTALNKDAFVLLGNLLVQALMRSVADEGYAPT